MTSSIRDRVLTAVKRRYVEHDLPGIGTVRIQSLTEKERADLEIAAAKDGASLRRRMIVAAVVDDNGSRVFSDDDLLSLELVDSAVTLALSDVIADHCQIVSGNDTTEDDVKN